VHLAVPLDLLVGRHCFLDEAAHLLLAVGMPLYRLEDGAMGRILHYFPRIKFAVLTNCATWPRPAIRRGRLPDTGAAT
jgi:hypothetical protein